MTSIHDLLTRYEQIAPDTRAKGRYFERLIREFIATDPVYQARFDEVWLWEDWPGRAGKVDTGIDLVAHERFGGGLCAIQCKFFSPNHYLQKGDIDSFFTASGKHPFTSRIIVTTTSKWSKHAVDALVGQQIPTTRIGINELEQSGIDWSLYRFDDPSSLAEAEPKKLRSHQIEALNAVIDGFDEADRGRLIMACGTGKTFTSLRIAERVVPPGGSVLFLVPSIALLSQSLREWIAQADRPMRAFAICSDTKVGKSSEDLRVTDLAYPATTDAPSLVAAVSKAANPEGLTVYFSTYQSIGVVSAAQDAGIPRFDLVICDEAHRTAGKLGGEDESHFVRVHNDAFIKADKRLYMTATPKIFGEGVKAKAKDAAVELASMDDESTFGPEFHRLGFGEAVERQLLTDYKVLVLAVSEDAVSTEFQQQFKTDDFELNLDDAARVAGIYKALSKSGVEGLAPEDRAPMRRAVAFSRSIKDSQHVTTLLDGNRAVPTGLASAQDALLLESNHVDGTMNVMRRTELLDWLKDDAPGNTTRILTNARCLSEGVDVPSLDAVIFLNSRDSQVDVVQSVGRVMRKLEGKHYGYIILPIAIAAGDEPERALSDNKKYKVVWEVLRALRAHDERFEARIESFDLNRKKTDEQVQVIGIKDFAPPGDGGGNAAGTTQVTLDFTPLGEEWREAVYAKILQKVGEREYWENWAGSVADIATRQTERIRGLVETSTDARASFERFVQGLRDNLNPSITESDAMEMLAQHLITQPVLEALFEGYGFAGHNPVAQVMQRMLDELEGANLETERAELEGFYASVRSRVKQITDAQGKQDFLKLLYQRFFAVAMKKASERFGIVYTPTEIVDFILRSADELSKEHFGVGLGDPGVHILDPFTGTGTFIVRLLQLGLISDAQLPHKYREELHANEISLLAYYVAAVNIEEAYHQRMGGNYVPFSNILLTDTFQMTEDDDALDSEGVFEQNNARVVRQKAAKFHVIIGNPPYSVGQGSANDNNQNLSYGTLDRRVRDTYVASSSAQNKNNLYDSYIRAIRWASDRLDETGIIGFVTNGGFIDGKTADGLRKSLADEFVSIRVLNLRGNALGSGAQRKKEAGNVFGAGTRTSVAILLLTKDARWPRHGSAVLYHDIGDHLSQREKLHRLETMSSSAETDWVSIQPDSAGDWISQRSPEAQRFNPMGARSGGNSPAIFALFAAGLQTNRDAWVYSSSQTALETNVQAMIKNYNLEVDRWVAAGKPQPVIEFIDGDTTKISWSRSLRDQLARQRHLSRSTGEVRTALYRPFQKAHVYFDRYLNHERSRLPSIFPTTNAVNSGIYVVAPGENSYFAALAVSGAIPDLHLLATGQFFPKYRYEKNEPDPNQLGAFDTGDEWARIDNVTDEALADYRATYPGAEVTKDDIFHYVYGILHSPEYRTRFAADLKKMLPRIPKVRDFVAFRDAGRELAKLHMDYETAPRYPGLVIDEPNGASLLVTKMRYGGKRPNLDKTTIIYNDDVTISGIPLEAHEYMLGSRSALDWILERYQVTVDKASHIKNDPNDWGLEHGNPRYILDLIGSIVTVSTETVRIVKELPGLEILET
jgi:predicted helicase